MSNVTVFGTTYVIDPVTLPKSVFHSLNFLIGRFGENLDLGPAWARHKAFRLASRFAEVYVEPEPENGDGNGENGDGGEGGEGGEGEGGEGGENGEGGGEGGGPE